MFAVRVELLGGAYRASSFEDRRQPEWPPHPARLFFAAVAAVHENVPPVPSEHEALEWWEGLGAPKVHLGAHGSGDLVTWRRRTTVDHYVPGNNPTSWTRDVQGQWQTILDLEAALADARTGAATGNADRAAKALDRARATLVDKTRAYTARSSHDSPTQMTSVVELLPENRNRQPRNFPTVVPMDPVFFFSWPGAQADRHAVVLDEVLGRIARLGHSSSAVSCSVVDAVPPATLTPAEDGPVSLRTVASGVLDALERDFARHGGNTARVLPALLTGYASPKAASRHAARPTNDAEWIVLTLARGEKLHASRALDLAVAVRSALLRHAVDPAPPLISGHEPGVMPTPPTSAPHIAAVPLLDATHPRSDGAIHAVAIVVPPGVEDHDRAALMTAISAWQASDDDGMPVTLPGGSLRRFSSARSSAGAHTRRGSGVTDRSFWSTTAAEWASVSPIALDRHPKSRPGSDGYVAETAELIARACRQIGLPEPVDSVCAPNSHWSASPPVAGHAPANRRSPSRTFAPFRTRSGERRHTVHARLRFGEPVGGPIVIGSGRFYGYGLLYPIREPDGRGQQ